MYWYNNYIYNFLIWIFIKKNIIKYKNKLKNINKMFITILFTIILKLK